MLLVKSIALRKFKCRLQLLLQAERDRAVDNGDDFDQLLKWLDEADELLKIVDEPIRDQVQEYSVKTTKQITFQTDFSVELA